MNTSTAKFMNSPTTMNWILASGLLLITMTGCQSTDRCQQCVVPRSLGTSVELHRQQQQANAERDDFVISQHEWYSGGLELGPQGRRHIAELAQRLQTESQNVVIETSDPDLKVYPEISTAVQQASHVDEQRRMAVIQLLSETGISQAESRVVIGRSLAEGLRGSEASRVFRSLNSRGGGFGGGGGGGGGLGGGGGGGFGGGGGGGFGGGGGQF